MSTASTSKSPSGQRPWARWLMLLVTSLAVAFVATDTARPPALSLQVGDVAPRTLKAPYAITWTDFEELEAQRERARRRVAPVFVRDEGLADQLASRLSTTFDLARVRLEEDEAARSAGGGDSSPSPEMTRAAVGELITRELGIQLSRSSLDALVSAAFPAEAAELGATWVQVALIGQMVVGSRDGLPMDGRGVEVVGLNGGVTSTAVDDLSMLVTLEYARRSIKLAALEAARTREWAGAVGEIAEALLGPNLYYSAEKTLAAQDAAERAVEAVPYEVQRGEAIFQEGIIVTDAQLSKYEALQRSARDEGGLLAAVLSTGGLMFLWLGTLYGFRGRVRAPDLRETGAAASLLVLAAILSRLVVESGPGVAILIGYDVGPTALYYATPIAGVAVLLRVLLGERWLGPFLGAVSSVAVVVMRGDVYLVIYFLITSMVAVGSVGQNRERVAVLRAGLYAGIAGAAAVSLLHVVDLFALGTEVERSLQIRPLWWIVFAIVGGFFSSFLALAVVPVFEVMGFVTNYRMQELANLNHPLMRQLFLRAPGTHHHSMMVGTLAEAACEAIGADGLQAKIAAYFHDIGKSKRPQYFVENQQPGANRHDHLTPEQSAAVIIEHVTEGVRLAEEHRLPGPIIDNIKMHHGTGLLQFFYSRAQMAADDPADVDASKFRYPGPKPSTREAGIVMLADKVEAATRTIKQPTEDSIRSMILRIINSVMADGQFSNCPLTVREIYVVAETFVRVLTGIHHQRIVYADTKDVSEGSGSSEQRATRNAGSITLDIEGPEEKAAILDTAGIFNEEIDLPDEDTDYEAVGNLPAGVLD